MQRGQSHCHASSRRHSSQAIRLEKAGAAPGKDGRPMLGQKSAKLPCFGHSRYSAGKNCLFETIIVANSRRQLFANAAIAASRLVTVRRCAVFVVPEGECPYPRCPTGTVAAFTICLTTARPRSARR